MWYSRCNRIGVIIGCQQKNGCWRSYCGVIKCTKINVKSCCIWLLNFSSEKTSKKFLTNGTWCCIINKLSTKADSAAGPWKLNKTETCGTLIVGLETHVNQFQNLQVIHTGRKRLCLSDYSDLTLCKWLNTIYKEFDPGSGRTLAACLTHASRTELRGACFS